MKNKRMTQRWGQNILGGLSTMSSLKILERMMLEVDILSCILHCRIDIRINVKFAFSDL